MFLNMVPIWFYFLVNLYLTRKKTRWDLIKCNEISFTCVLTGSRTNNRDTDRVPSGSLFVILFDYLIILIWLIDGSPKMFLRSTSKLCTGSTQTPRTLLLHLALLGQVGAPHMFHTMLELWNQWMCLNQRCWIYASIIMTLLLIHHVIHEEPYTLSPCYFHPEKNIDLPIMWMK